jgi:hypothetical protein
MRRFPPASLSNLRPTTRFKTSKYGCPVTVFVVTAAIGSPRTTLKLRSHVASAPSAAIAMPTF